ncbi:hypothetical protein [Lentilitoribacter sp. EG35]|jgi:radical SAM superfamily enzyme|uniref:hypothetical protein n=1 Tax=Lentilitoribacter sp. EG35 TaxID=3234192 RepID=UPI003460CE41
MKIHRAAPIFLFSFALAACTTYGSHKKIGTYSYSGKKYDIYEAKIDTESRDDDEKTVRFIVDKGVAPPDRPGGKIISSCTFEEKTADADTIARCNKRFTAAIEKRENPEESSSDDGGGMY